MYNKVVPKANEFQRYSCCSSAKKNLKFEPVKGCLGCPVLCRMGGCIRTDRQEQSWQNDFAGSFV